jgi:hypothetical protein
MTTNLDNEIRNLTAEELDLVCGAAEMTASFSVDMGGWTISGAAFSNGSSEGRAATNDGKDEWVVHSPR